MSKTAIKPLKKKISREDVKRFKREEYKKVKNNELSCCNSTFKNTFNLLESQGVFHVDRNPKFKESAKWTASNPESAVRNTPVPARMLVQNHLYEGIDLELEKLTNADIKKHANEIKNGWQYTNLDNLRSGRAPFVPEVAEYFHDAFKLAFDKIWANSISPMDFVLSDIREIISKLVQVNLPGNWQNADPLSILEVAYRAQQSGIDWQDRIIPKFRLQRKSDERLSDLGNDPLDDYEPVRPDDDLFAKESYHLRIHDIPEDWCCTLFEFGHIPFKRKEGTHMVQAQVCNNLEREYTDLVVRFEEEKFITASKHPGDYGYCLIAQKGEVYLEQLELLNGEKYLTPDEFRALCIEIAKECIPDNDTAIGLLNYSVGPPSENF